jgi:Flp pilus assembly pilin Flp
MFNQIILLQAMIVGWVRDHVSAKDDSGASLVEYALLLALIAVVAIVALQALGSSVSSTLGNVANDISS